MSTYTELVGSSVLRDTHGVSGMPVGLFRSMARALKVVLAADGEIHPAELNAYLETCRRFGANDNLLHELRHFDPSTTTLERCFEGVDADSIPARVLLYEALRIAKAEGSLAEPERRAAGKAAEHLGVDRDTLAHITALVDAENALRALRVSLLLPPGLRAYA